MGFKIASKEFEAKQANVDVRKVQDLELKLQESEERLDARSAELVDLEKKLQDMSEIRRRRILDDVYPRERKLSARFFRQWSNEDVCFWLYQNNNQYLADKFSENGIRGKDLEVMRT